jgi:pimeloyl-ACP methyl ester carboxylesterase
VNDLTRQGIDALKAGDRTRARQLLSRSLQQDPQDVDAWLALSFAVEVREQQILCLRRVLQIDPSHGFAQSQLAQLVAVTTSPSAPAAQQPTPLVQPTSLSDERQREVERESEPKEAEKPVSPPVARKRGIRRLLSWPRLPVALIVFAALIIFTDASLILIGQPIDYWLDPSRVSSRTPFWIQAMLIPGAQVFAAITLAYLLVVVLLMRFLPRRLGLILWTMVSFTHLQDTISWSWISLQGFLSLGQMSSIVSGALGMVLLVAPAGVMGLVLAYVLMPSKPVRDVRGIRSVIRRLPALVGVALSVLWVALLGYGISRAMDVPVSGWRPVNPEHRPTARVEGQVAYDTRRGRAVMFGGASGWEENEWLYEADTWEWNGTDWVLCSPPTSPPGRVAHSIAYDEARGLVVLFGGKNRDGVLGDTWEWDGGEWHERHPSSVSPARSSHQMVYDSRRNSVVLYGGYDEAGTFFSDAWEWDGKQWLPISFDSASPVASGFALAYDPADECAIALLVGDPTGTWMWKGDRWWRPQLAAEPPERQNTELVYDAYHQRVMLFGGNRKGQTFGDTWWFDGESWEHLDPPLSPSARWGHSSFYDPGRQRVMVFGGFDGSAYLDDMWEYVPLDGAVSLEDETSPSVRETPQAPEAEPTLTGVRQQGVYTPTFESTRCFSAVPAGAQADCGYVLVPEDRYGDPAGTVKLAVAIYRSMSDLPAPEPVVLLGGGPGDGAIESSAEFYEQVIVPLLMERDFVVLDQRGTGLSELALACPELTSLYLRALARDVTDSDRMALYTDALLACHDRLVTRGANLAAYTTAASAADVRDLVEVLGCGQVDLYAISYGTRLAQVVMRDYPQIVRSAVLDSVVPVEVEWHDQDTRGIAPGLSRVFGSCALDAECEAAYPDLETAFYDLIKELDESPVAVQVSDPVQGETREVMVDGGILMDLMWWVVDSSGAARTMPRVIYDLRGGDFGSLSYALTIPAHSYQDINIGMMMSVNCHEQALALAPEQRFDGPTIEALGLSAVYGGPETPVFLCEMWGAAPLDAHESEPLVSDIPVLILAGEYDSTTPSTRAVKVAGRLGNSFFFEFPGLGHAPSTSSAADCPLNIIGAFLRDPSMKPDGSCIAEMAPLDFVTPFRAGQTVEFEPFSSAKYLIEGIAPRGWKDVGNNCYNRAQALFDPTQLTLQASSMRAEEFLDWIAHNYQGVGMTAIPRAVGEREANDLIWKLYVSELRGNPVDLALAESDSLTLLVVLSTRNDERDAMYEAVYLPVIDALEPIE